jgi:predicted AAA+ superfamily ATPase
MRFIAGPRQCGKTTLARGILDAHQCGSYYYNWDLRQTRERYRQDANFVDADRLSNGNPALIWACFDEIHKYPKWKNILKGFFDSHEATVRLLVTGSAKLDLFRNAGDSLAGRYFLYRLNPFILPEICNRSMDYILPASSAIETVEKMMASSGHRSQLDALLMYSAFPEPLLNGTARFAKKWHAAYLDRLVNEDIRDISHIRSLEKISDLLVLLPERVGSPLSIQSLARDLELHFGTVKNCLRYLNLGYVLFELGPYVYKKGRFVKKEKKVYFYDWAPVLDSAKRFENFVAFELKARIDLWNEIMPDTYGLCFVRTRDGKETDFLITQNDAPYLLLEAKLSDTDIPTHHLHHARLLGGIPVVQVIYKSGILRKQANMHFCVSADRFLA